MSGKTEPEFGLVGYDPIGEAVEVSAKVLYTANPKKKPNSRHLVLGKYRLLLFKKNPKKPEKCIHFFNIVSLAETKLSTEMVVILYFKKRTDKKPARLCIKSPDVWNYVKHIRTSLRNAYSNFREAEYLQVEFANNSVGVPDTAYTFGPAEAILEAYLAHCNYRQTRPSAEFTSYVMSLVDAGEHCCDLALCPGIDRDSKLAFEFASVMMSLARDNYFKGLVLKGKPHKGALHYLGNVLKTNTAITKAVFSGLQEEQTLTTLSAAISTSCVHVLSLSNNKFVGGFTAWTAFCNNLLNMSHALVSLDLSYCGLGPKHMMLLFNAFERNWGVSLSIRHLNLSGNKFEDAGTTALSSWLSKVKEHCKLQTLLLADSDLDFSFLAMPLRYTPNFEHFDMSGTRLDDKKVDVGSDLKRFVEASKALRVLVLRGTNPLPDAIEGTIYAIGNNNCLPPVALCLADNSLGAEGGVALARACLSLKNIHHLDIDNCKLKAKNLMEILRSLMNASCLNSLSMSYNVDSEKDSKELMDTLVDVLNANKSITALKFASRRPDLQRSIVRLLDYVGSNDSLTYLDISGHQFGDVGAGALSQSLSKNATLTELQIDDNAITSTGYLAMLYCLQENETMQHMRYPQADLEYCHNHLNPVDQIKLHETMYNIMRRLEENHAAKQTPAFCVEVGVFPDVDAPVSVIHTDEVPDVIRSNMTAPLTILDEATVVRTTSTTSLTSDDADADGDEDEDNEDDATPRARTMPRLAMSEAAIATPAARSAPPTRAQHRPSTPPPAPPCGDDNDDGETNDGGACDDEWDDESPSYAAPPPPPSLPPRR
eukprot:TRINITY_DN3406_c0_g1_i1.p1 TRINITY_DN3406_c0_g1~~TRINITY_DN3406_c0_g1_i1.p1  ORF type:complete len:832 (-),score=196.42 TRINITY_DN3406_c0_g1_i1:597-3068(-)